MSTDLTRAQSAEARHHLDEFLKRANSGPTDTYGELDGLLYGTVNIPEQLAVVIKTHGNQASAETDGLARYHYRQRMGHVTVKGYTQQTSDGGELMSIDTRDRSLPMIRKVSRQVIWVSTRSESPFNYSNRSADGSSVCSTPRPDVDRSIEFYANEASDSPFETNAQVTAIAIEMGKQASARSASDNNEFRQVMAGLTSQLLAATLL